MLLIVMEIPVNQFGLVTFFAATLIWHVLVIASRVQHNSQLDAFILKIWQYNAVCYHTYNYIYYILFFITSFVAYDQSLASSQSGSRRSTCKNISGIIYSCNNANLWSSLSLFLSLFHSLCSVSWSNYHVDHHHCCY